MKILTLTFILLTSQGCHLWCTRCNAKPIISENLTIGEIKVHLKYLVKIINEKDLKAIRTIPDKFNMLEILIRDMKTPNWKGVGSFIKIEKKTNLADLTYYYHYSNSVHQIYFNYTKENEKYKFTGLWLLAW